MELEKKSSIQNVLIINLCDSDNTDCFNKDLFYSGTVPGDIYTDLFNSKIIDDPLYGDNHLFTTWISNDDWSYSRQFDFDMQQLNVLHLR